MAGPAALFRELHRQLRFAHDLQEQLDRIPRQRRAFQARLAKADQAVKDEQEALKRLKVTASDKEKTLKSKGEAIRRYEQQYNEVTSKKEFDALKIEIAHNREQCGKLEDEILEALTETDERTARLPEVEKALAQVRDEVNKFEAEAGKRQADLQAQLTQMKGEIAASEAHIPDDYRAQYDRTKSSLGHDGFALVRGRVCTACNTEIIRNLEMLLLAEQFVVCKSCGRILYPPERPAAAESDA